MSIDEKTAQKKKMYDDGIRELHTCCSHLRCKSMFYSVTERPGLLHESEVLAYWCDITQENIGCDNGDVSIPECQPGRKCCEM